MSDSFVELYRNNGFVSPIPVLTTEEAADAARLVDDLAAAGRVPKTRLPFPHRFFRWAFELAAHPALLDVVEQIAGPDILTWGTLVLSKPAGSRATVSWHQDCAYTKFLDGSCGLSAWIALTPATSESGCMRVIPGFHDARLPFTTAQEPDDMLPRGLRVTTRFDESRAVDLELRPGQASLHEISVIHGSSSNRSALPRTGFIIRYATPAMRQPENPVYCVRGKPGAIRCEEPPPVGAGLEEGLAPFLEFLRSPASS